MIRDEFSPTTPGGKLSSPSTPASTKTENADTEQVPEEQAEEDLVQHVRPLQGTDSYYELSRVNTLPLVSMPWAMTSWTLQTSTDNWFFGYRSVKVQGVRATRQPSPWMGDYGALCIMPQTGVRLLPPGTRSSSYRVDRTEFSPHYLRAHLLRYRITVEVTPTDRCAMIRFTFPPDHKGTARVVFDIKGPGQAEINPATGSISLVTRASSGGTPRNFGCYYEVRLDRRFTGYGFFRDANTVWDNETTRSDSKDFGVFVEFFVNGATGATVQLRVASSFIDAKTAAATLEREVSAIPSFAELQTRARAAWNERLGRVVVEGASPAQLQTLYSCLYRAALFPHRLYETSADGKQVVHYSPYDGKVHAGVMYADNGFWDTHRTVYPLYAILWPKQLEEILAAWVAAYTESGWFPKWPSPGHRDCMVGSHIDAIIADAVVKGIAGFDVAVAYQGLRKHANVPTDSPAYGRPALTEYVSKGYVPDGLAGHSVSATLDYAYGDFCIGQVARAVGAIDDAAVLDERAKNYAKLFDSAVGFMRPRNGMTGDWVEPFNEFAWGGPYVESSAWQSSWAVPHDVAGLAVLFPNGPTDFVQKLEQLLVTPPRFDATAYHAEIHEMTEMAFADFGQYAHSNQPSHHILYLFAALGHPWRTQYWTRRVLDELYGPGPDGFPGDEDNGEMASWYVLSAVGLYPLCPGMDEYVLTSPLFPRAILRMENGNTFEVEARGNTPDTRYIRESSLNGKRLGGRTYLRHNEVVRGGLLVHHMAAEPVTTLIADALKLPFSLSVPRIKL